MKKKLPIYILSILISGIFLYLAFRKINFEEVKASFMQAQYPWLIGVALLITISFLLRGVRWQIILSPIKRCKFFSVFSVLVIGFMANNLLPFRMGEFARAYLNGKKENISKSSSLATITIERIFDGLTILLLFVILSFILSVPPWVRSLATLGAVIFLVALFLVITLAMKQSFSVTILKKCFRILPHIVCEKFSKLLDLFVDGLKIIRHGHKLIFIMCVSLLIWLCEGLMIYLVALSLQISIGYTQAMFTLLIISLGIMTPSSPGYVGVYEYFATLALGLFGVVKSQALTLAIILHFMAFTLTTLAGLWFLAREHMTLADLKRQQEGN